MKHPPYDCLNQQCPSRNILVKVCDKWSLLMILCLLKGVHRFGALKRAVGDISPKVATQSLKKLESLGLITKTIYDEKPLKVEYQLSELGLEFAQLVLQLKEWTERNAATLLQGEPVLNAS